MNFFNGPKVRNSVNQYYVYTKRNKLVKNLITLIDNNLGFSLFQAIEKTKIELSEKCKSSFYFSTNEIEINEEIELEEYNSIIQPDIFTIQKYLNQFLETNQINISEIDSLFITGGTSMVGAIQTLFKENFPLIPIQTGDNFLSVSQGLALSEYLFNDYDEVTL